MRQTCGEGPSIRARCDWSDRGCGQGCCHRGGRSLFRGHGCLCGECGLRDDHPGLNPCPKGGWVPQQTYAVSGMTCASCVRHVEKALVATPGVSSATVNLATSKVTVEGTASFEDMVLQVEDAGYGLNRVELDAPSDEDLLPARGRMIFALVLTAPMLATMIPGFGWGLPGWLQALLATPVVFGAGLGF